MEGQSEHRRMRSVVAPAFSLDALRTFSPVVWETANRLQTKLEQVISDSPNGEAKIDLTKWAARSTLDVIGKVGLSFDFQFGESPEAQAIFRSWKEQTITAIQDSAFFGMVRHVYSFYTSISSRHPINLGRP